MRRAVPALLAVVLFLAGCVAQAGNDPLAYTRKPLYSGGFDLDGMNATDAQEFRVEDGSIVNVHVRVWVNATAGGARVDVYAPSGKLLHTTTEASHAALPLELGVWRVEIVPLGPSAGHVSVLATRT